MAFEKYGGYTWNAESTEPSISPVSRGFGIAVAAGLGAGGFYGLTRELADGTRPIDTVYHASRMAGNLTPFSIANTVRLPEFTSPFISAAAQGEVAWAPELLQSSETYEYLKRITGRSTEELAAAGLGSGVRNKTEGLSFRRQPGSARGSLVSTVLGQEHVLSDSISVIQGSMDELDFFSKRRDLNRAAYSILQVTGLAGEDWFKTEKFFATDKQHARWIPFSSVTGPVSSIDDLSRRSTFLRSYSAFGMERLNTLLETSLQQIPFVGNLNQSLDELVGMNAKVRSGSAMKMFAGFGMKAAAVGGGVIAVQQLDWVRRHLEEPGQLFASGTVAAGIAFAAKKLKYTPRTAFLAGVASFFGQLALPGFDQGVMPGLATGWAQATKFRAAVSPFNIYRRTVEGFLPGVSSWQTGALLSIGAVSLASLPVWGGKRVPDLLLQKFGASTFGLQSTVKIGDVADIPVTAPKTVRQMFWESMRGEASKRMGATQALIDLDNSYAPEFVKNARLTKILGSHSSFQNTNDVLKKMIGLWQKAEDASRDIAKANPVNRSLEMKLQSIQGRFEGNQTMIGRGQRAFEGMKATAVHSFFGADALEPAFMRNADNLGFRPKFGRAGAIAATVFAAQQLLTGGLLGSMETAGELDALYTGKKLVEVRKGRWWEGGGTPFEGDNIMYSRPHLYHLMMNRVREKGIWGADEDDISPIHKFFKKNFTYDLERQNYYDRPYPITSAAFQDVPVIGGFLAATVGRLIKPAKIMHADEWIRQGPGGMEFAETYEGWTREPSYDLGAKGSGIPTSHLAPSRLIGAAIYQGREMEGLCFVGETLITTYRGRIPIKDVEIGDLALTLDGTYQRVIDRLQFDNHSKPLIEIKTSTIPSTLVCTTNHWIPALIRERHPCGAAKPFASYSLVDVQAETLCPGDYLVAPIISEEVPAGIVDLAGYTDIVSTDDWLYWGRTKANYSAAYEAVETLEGEITKETRKLFSDSWGRDHTSHAILSYSRGTPIKRYKRYVEITDKVLWFLGWYVAEGNTETKNSRIQLTLSAKEDKEATELERIAKDELGCLPQTRAGLKDSSIAIRMSHSGLVGWLNAEFGIGAHAKRIPSWVKCLPKEQLVYFVSGVCLGDGHSKGFKSSSRELVLDVMECLLKLGVRCNVQLDKTDNLGRVYSQLFVEKVHQPRYQEVLCCRVPPTLEEPGNRGGGSFIREGKLFVRVKSVRRLSEHPTVYDLTIEQQHYYVAEEIAVHNTGWMKNVASNVVTGNDTYFGERSVLASAGDMTSPVNMFWEGNLGGFFFSNEALRRFLPRPHGTGDKINPIFNSMPSWLPEKHHYGDPYRQIEWGEARLPGTGYEALHPELKGMDPENYPLIYKYSILSDVAPHSEEYRRVKQGLYRKRQEGTTTHFENQYMDYIDSVAAKKMMGVTGDPVHERAIELPGSGITQSLYAGAQSFIREAAAPGEYLIPMGFRPFQKLMSDRSPVEQYEYERLYGSKVSFWDKPWRDWFRPSLNSAAHFMGWEGKPLWRQEADATNEYFDKLEFMKWMSLAQQAEASGNQKDKTRYMYLAGGTRHGVNPQGSPMSIYWSLPAEERPFFNAFANAQGSERDRILEMIPEDQQHLYKALWSRTDSGDPNLYPGTMGPPDRQHLTQQFHELQNSGDLGRVPKEDWIGYHQDVDLKDVKVMYVDSLGKDLHDFGLWERQLRETETRQPYLDGAVQQLRDQSSVDRGMIGGSLYQLMRGNFQGPWVSSHTSPGTSGQSYGKVVYTDNRDYETQQLVERTLGL